MNASEFCHISGRCLALKWPVQKHILDLEIDRIKTMPRPGSMRKIRRLMRKLRRCPAQDQCSKNTDFCHFGLFWQNPGYRTKIHKFDIPAKCSKFYECTFFSTFFPTCFEKKVVFSRKKSLLHLKKKHFFRLYLQRALICNSIFYDFHYYLYLFVSLFIHVYTFISTF